VATFIRGVYATETQKERKAGDGVRDGRKQTRSLLDAYDDASERLVLNEDQLRASSRLCVGDVAATPTLESRCGSLTAEESEAWEADRAERSDSATGAPPPPARAFSPFYLRTGLGVDECEESDLGDVRGRVTE
jgi:hypothetical protein